MKTVINSRSQLEDNELQLLKIYKCNTCGLSSEFLQNVFAGPGLVIRCEYCGSTKLENIVGSGKDDYYW